MITEKENEEKLILEIKNIEQENSIEIIQPSIDPSIDIESIEKRTVKVISGYCGVGKSRSLFMDWKNKRDKKKVYLTHSHNFLEEQAKRSSKTRHIKGMRRICPYKSKKNGPEKFISNLLKSNLPNKIICTQCRKMKLEYSAYRKCPYQKQFYKKPNTLAMPIEYSYTTKIKKYEPNIIAVDDCLTRKMNHKKLTELNNFFEHIKIISESAFDDNITTKSFEEIIFEDEFEEIVYKCKNNWNDWVEYLIEVMKNDEEYEEFFIPYSGIYIQEFYTYRRYASIYGLQKQFATPSLFYLFDLVFETADTELILIEAMPNIEFLKDLLKLYLKEKNRLLILEINEIEPEKIPNSKFYQCYGYSGAWYPTTSSIVNSKDTVRRMKGWIKEILKSEYNDRENCCIGIIKPKRVMIDDLIDKKEFPNVKYLNFGNLRGLNKLEKCNPLFVIGSYNINKKDLLKEYKLWFKFLPEDITTYQEKRYKYNNDKLDNFRSMFEEEEQFHAVFRSRALTYDREVYCFGLIPREIYNLFEVEEIRFGRKNKRYTEEKTIFVLDKIHSLGGIIREKKMRELLTEKFSIKDETARRILKEIVEKNEQLKFIRYSIGRNKPKAIILSL